MNRGNMTASPRDTCLAEARRNSTLTYPEKPGAKPADPALHRAKDLDAVKLEADAPGLYSAADFHRAVLSARPRTAVFDCDGTLWAPDAGYGFMLWSLDRSQPANPLADLLSAQQRAWIDDRYRLYEAGVVDEATICGEMVQLYAGLPDAALRQAARAYYAARVAPYVYLEMAALVSELQQAGTELWAVSSTNRWVIEAAVWDQGLAPFFIPPQRILAAEVAVIEGHATDQLLAVPTDEAKREALKAAGLAHPDVVFGNSIHDAAMLEIAAHPFPVNANQALTSFAHERGWRIFRPADTGWASSG